MRTSFICFLVIGFALSSCNEKKNSEQALAVENASVAAVRSDEVAMRDVIARGLEREFNVGAFPVGDVELISSLNSALESTDYKQKRFKSDYLEYLKRLETRGYVSLKLHQQSEMETLGRAGSRTVTVTPTDRAKRECDAELTAQTSGNYLQFRTGVCNVLEIIKIGPYKVGGVNEVEEYRLVLGTYRRTNTNTLGEDVPPAEMTMVLKFRAVLRLNPFTKKYVYVTGDWGKPEDDGWKTHNVL